LNAEKLKAENLGFRPGEGRLEFDVMVFEVFFEGMICDGLEGLERRLGVAGLRIERIEAAVCDFPGRGGIIRELAPVEGEVLLGDSRFAGRRADSHSPTHCRTIR
jgi:hypothetical protein